MGFAGLSSEEAGEDGMVVLGVMGSSELNVYDRYSVFAQPVPGIVQSRMLGLFARKASNGREESV